MSDFIKQFFCEDCKVTMENMINDNFKVSTILTSPPYNTVRKGSHNLSEKSRIGGWGRYDSYHENKSNEEYIEWTIKIFELFDLILEKNGVVIYNLSYGSENTELMWKVVFNILNRTNFTIGDNLIWKKKTAMPHPASKKLTRICEYIYIFCRKDEFKSYNSNNKISKIGKNGQTYYVPIFNFIEAPNNDEPCKLNKATFSTDLVLQLLSIYAPPESIVYDPFMGTGTTAKACEIYGCDWVGSEISEAQVKYSKERLKNYQTKLEI